MFPSFAQPCPESRSMKQQDAEECWSQIISAIHAHFKWESRGQSFVDVFMSGQMVSSLTCATSPNEPTVHRMETFAKLNCYFGITTNIMQDGIFSELTEQLEKHSEALGRNALWINKCRISRLPKYLVVHFVRYYWKRNINKGAKILRKVRFPIEWDASALCTE